MTERPDKRNGSQRLHWIILGVALVLGAVLQYSAQIGLLPLVERLLNVPTLHDVFEGALAPWYVVPVAYAALALGRQTGLLVLLITVLLVTPHVFLESQAMTRAMLILNVVSVTVSGGIVSWLAGWWREARHRTAGEARTNALLRQAAEAMATTTSEQGILRALGETARGAVGADVTLLTLFPAPGAESDVVLLHGGGGFGRAIEEALRAHPLSMREPLVEEIASAPRPLIIEDLSRDPRVPTPYASVGVHGVIRVPIRLDHTALGFLAAGSKAPRRFTEAHGHLLQALADGAAVALARVRAQRLAEEARLHAEALAQDLRGSHEALATAHEDIVRSLVRAVELRDPATHGHGHRVRGWARQLARALGYPEPELDSLATAAELHDVGKIGISDLIILKGSGLTPSEMAEIRRHPEIGAGLVRGLPAASAVAAIVRAHHERWDGRGYPDGLAGEKIPWGARIVAVPDTYDAMTTDRPYRKGLSHGEATAELRKGAGTQFDPAAVEAFIQLIEDSTAAERAE